MKSGLPPKILGIRQKKLSFLMISVVIDCNIFFFSNVYCLNYSTYACMHWVFLFWLKYASELFYPKGWTATLNKP